MVRLLIILLLLTSCSATERANRHLHKAARHEAAAIALGAEIKTDTVFTDRTFIKEEVVHDTLVRNVNFTDTIRVETERIAWKVKVNTVEKEVFVEAKCKADTVTVEVPVLVDKKIKTGYSLYELIGLCLFLFILGVILSPLVKKLVPR